MMDIQLSSTETTLYHGQKLCTPMSIQINIAIINQMQSNIQQSQIRNYSFMPNATPPPVMQPDDLTELIAYINQCETIDQVVAILEDYKKKRPEVYQRHITRNESMTRLLTEVVNELHVIVLLAYCPIPKTQLRQLIDFRIPPQFLMMRKEVAEMSTVSGIDARKKQASANLRKMQLIVNQYLVPFNKKLSTDIAILWLSLLPMDPNGQLDQGIFRYLKTIIMDKQNPINIQLLYGFVAAELSGSCNLILIVNGMLEDDQYLGQQLAKLLMNKNYQPGRVLQSFTIKYRSIKFNNVVREAIKYLMHKGDINSVMDIHRRFIIPIILNDLKKQQLFSSCEKLIRQMLSYQLNLSGTLNLEVANWLLKNTMKSNERQYLMLVHEIFRRCLPLNRAKEYCDAVQLILRGQKMRTPLTTQGAHSFKQEEMRKAAQLNDAQVASSNNKSVDRMSTVRPDETGVFDSFMPKSNQANKNDSHNGNYNGNHNGDNGVHHQPRTSIGPHNVILFNGSFMDQNNEINQNVSTISQPMNHAMNQGQQVAQPNRQQINLQTSQISHPVNQTMTQSTNLSTLQPNQSIVQPISHPVNQTITHSTNLSTLQSTAPTNQPVNQPTNQSSIQGANQPLQSTLQSAYLQSAYNQSSFQPSYNSAHPAYPPGYLPTNQTLSTVTSNNYKSTAINSFVQSGNQPYSYQSNIPYFDTIMQETVKHNKQFIGLPNIGNTCYINSMLLSLFFCPKFHNQFMTVQTTDIVMRYIQTIFGKLIKKETVSMKEYMFQLKKALPGDYSTDSSQQDVMEFGRYLIDKIVNLNAQLKRIFEIKQVETIICPRGDLIDRRQCSQYFMLLRFPNPKMFGVEGKEKQPQLDLMELMTKDFFSNTEIQGKFTCQVCKNTYDKRIRKTRFLSMPQVLIVVLGRFSYDAQLAMKICDGVRFDNYIDFGPLVSQNVRQNYILKAFINHMGRTADSGHYQTYVRHPKQQSKWLNFDDDFVTQSFYTKVADLVSNMNQYDSPYVLFYEKI